MSYSLVGSQTRVLSGDSWDNDEGCKGVLDTRGRDNASFRQLGGKWDYEGRLTSVASIGYSVVDVVSSAPLERAREDKGGFFVGRLGCLYSRGLERIWEARGVLR